MGQETLSYVCPISGRWTTAAAAGPTFQEFRAHLRHVLLSQRYKSGFPKSKGLMMQ